MINFLVIRPSPQCGTHLPHARPVLIGEAVATAGCGRAGQRAMAHAMQQDNPRDGGVLRSYANATLWYTH